MFRVKTKKNEKNMKKKLKMREIMDDPKLVYVVHNRKGKKIQKLLKFLTSNQAC